jgi:hypothetical protein
MRNKKFGYLFRRIFFFLFFLNVIFYLPFFIIEILIYFNLFIFIDIQNKKFYEYFELYINKLLEYQNKNYLLYMSLLYLIVGSIRFIYFRITNEEIF